MLSEGVKTCGTVTYNIYHVKYACFAMGSTVFSVRESTIGQLLYMFKKEISLLRVRKTRVLESRQRVQH